MMAKTPDATLRPRCYHLLVKQIEEDRAKRPGIGGDDRAMDTRRRARVIAIGADTVPAPGRTALGIKVGDRVLFGQDSGDPVSLDGKEYILMSAHDVLGLLVS